MKPLLKWAGGKSRLAPRLSEAFGGPCRGTYLEPFIGSGAVFLHRHAAGEVSEAVLGDANPKLVALHEAIRDDVDGVLEELSRFPTVDFRGVYYEVREAFNAGPHRGVRHAARFLWLNRAGFNGLYRENRRGGFNVPVGRYARVRIPDEAAFRAVSAAFAGVTFVAAGFETLLRRAGRGDQVYCDPPYVPLNATAAFTQYAAGGFDLDAQQALAQESQRAAFRGARVVLSNHDLPIVRHELYSTSDRFVIVDSLDVSRAISRSVESRKPIREVIARIGPFEQVA